MSCSACYKEAFFQTQRGEKFCSVDCAKEKNPKARVIDTSLDEIDMESLVSIFVQLYIVDWEALMEASSRMKQALQTHSNYVINQKALTVQDLQGTVMDLIKKDHILTMELILQWRGRNGEFVDLTRYPGEMVPAYVDQSSPRMLDLILKWRGPNGEFVDLSNYMYDQKVLSAAVQRTPDIFRMVLDWRGPKGEFVDPGVGWRLIKTIIRQRDPVFLTILLNWRGPGGKFVDLSDEMYRDYESLDELFFEIRRASKYGMLDQLLSWRGPNNEFLDVRIVKNAQVSWPDGVDVFLAKMLKWRGPNGEMVEYTEEDKKEWKKWQRGDQEKIDTIEKLFEEEDKRRKAAV